MIKGKVLTIKNKNIAIGFFGIPRSIRFTKESIYTNILDPIKSEYNTKIFCHFIQQEAISNPRTGEYTKISQRDYNEMASDQTRLTSEFDPNLMRYLLKLKKFGDVNNDNYRSLNNLINQLYSMRQLTNEIEQEGYDICLFVRPDLRYHDSMISVIDLAYRCSSDTVFLPEWQPWRGLNDRFAVCVGKKAIRAYGKRILSAENYCKYSMSPLNSERLLQFSLRENNISIKKIPNRASRVRADGVEVDEDFSLAHHLPTSERIKSSIYESGVRLSEITRTKSVLRTLGSWITEKH
ncbi:hypothetical protein N9801_00920 [Yoonia sp.]|nr:hypothetical protein [Yoonia sp.]MDB4240814.1 hypothetical protein [Yoonia sp.]